MPMGSRMDEASPSMRVSRIGVAAAVVAMSLAGVWLLADPAGAIHGITVDRIGGADRIQTAADVARATYPEGTDTALVAHAGDFPDALAAAPLARQRAAPVLLTDGEALSAHTRTVLRELGVRAVAIVGGPAAVSEAVADELRDEVDTVERVAGEHRYATAAEVARRIQAAADSGIGEVGGRRAAFLATGADFADALAASSPAASKDNPVPILLTHRDRLPEATRQALDDLEIQRVFVLGGDAAVAGTVDDELRGEPLWVDVDRLQGADRTQTARAVAHRARQPVDGGVDAGFGYDGRQVLLARGDEFPDALAAGPLGGLTQAPILSTPSPQHLGEHARGWLINDCPAIEVIRAVGGSAAVADETLAAAADCHAGRPVQDYEVTPLEVVVLAPGEAFELRGPARHDPQFLDSVDLALFPCGTVHSLEATWRFTDADGDGLADGFGSSDTDQAVITDIEGNATSTKVLRDVGPEGPGTLQFTLASDAPDCAVPVVFDDVNGNGQLDVGADGLALEFFGLGHVEWTSG